VNPETPVKRMPSRIGDVLILRTTRWFTVHVVGRVTKGGEQDCHAQANLRYQDDRPTAVALAKVFVAPGRQIFLMNVDSGEWSEIPS
jgi:hypothetical protein